MAQSVVGVPAGAYLTWLESYNPPQGFYAITLPGPAGFQWVIAYVVRTLRQAKKVLKTLGAAALVANVVVKYVNVWYSIEGLVVAA